MGRLEEIRKRALKKALDESRVSYDDNCNIRMHPKIVENLRSRNHSLGSHPVFPDSEEQHFEERVMSKRFSQVVNAYKRHFDSETVDPNEVNKNMLPLVKDVMSLEEPNKKVLEDLACDMVRKEYDMTEDDVELIVELTPEISMEDVRVNPSPEVIDDVEFDNHDSFTSAKDEVYKRRFLNAMVQGAAKKAHHMFHLFDDELSRLSPTLPSKYSKMMSAADLSYLINDDSTPKQSGGKVTVTFKDGKPVIHAQAMVFPVLIHELVKGVMEVLSLHGLPEDDKLVKYVTGKADYMNAEVWDMRLGPAIWERFTNCIDSKDFDNKHHIYMDLVSLPTDEFNHVMREVMMGSKEGKQMIRDISKEINREMDMDSYEDSVKELNDSDDILGYDDLDDIDLSSLM